MAIPPMPAPSAVVMVALDHDQFRSVKEVVMTRPCADMDRADGLSGLSELNGLSRSGRSVVMVVEGEATPPTAEGHENDRCDEPEPKRTATHQATSTGTPLPSSVIPFASYPNRDREGAERIVRLESLKSGIVP